MLTSGTYCSVLMPFIAALAHWRGGGGARAAARAVVTQASC